MFQADPATQLRRLAALRTLLPPQVEASGSRGLILDVALRQFAERGYGGTSVRDIAAACGLQPATLYGHFPSKEHVLAEICRIGHDEYLSGLRSAMLETSAKPRDQLAAWVRAHVLFHAHYAMLAVVCNSELHMLSPEMGAPINQLREQAVDLLMSIISRGGELKEFDVPNAWLCAAMIGGSGLRVAHWYTPDFELSADEVADTYVRLSWRIVGVSEVSS